MADEYMNIPNLSKGITERYWVNLLVIEAHRINIEGRPGNKVKQ